MAEDVVRFGKDGWAGSGAPSVNHNGAKRIKFRGTDVYGYLHMKNPVPHGLAVVEATLTIYVASASDWAGTHTVSVKRLSERARFGKLTWNNKPGTTGGTKDATVTSPTPAQAVNIDVTSHVQQWADGDPNYGWRVSTDSTTALKLWGFDSDNPPILTVQYAISPSQPVDLSPSGGAVSVAKPVVTFDAVDLSQPGDMSALQVQIDPAANATAPAFDSGEVASSIPELDLSATAYAGLADGASTSWRARYKSGEGVWGDWSEWVTFSRAAKGTLTITNPAAPPNNFVTEATPPFIHSFTGTQVAWRKWITEQADKTEILANSHKTDGADTSWTPPKKRIHDDGSYTIWVRVWDDVDRVATPGDPAYVEASRNFTFQQDATVDAPVMVSAAQQGVTPFVDLTFTRATAPDSWTILRDGKVIDALVDPADTLTTGTTHVYTDAGATPQVAHTYEVRAVVNGKASPKSATGTVTTRPAGGWLLDLETGEGQQLLDLSVDYSEPDMAGVYRTRTGIVRVRQALGVAEGKVEGNIVENAGHDIAAATAFVKAMEKRGTCQLVWNDMSLEVQIGNVAVWTPPNVSRDRVKAVGFDFWAV